MKLFTIVLAALAPCMAQQAAQALSSVEKIRNDKVLVTEDTLAPGESEAEPVLNPCVFVFMTSGSTQVSSTGAAPRREDVTEGETTFHAAGPATLLNTGTSPLRVAVIRFLTPGQEITWGTVGLAPHSTLLLENRFARAYDIKIPSQYKEPQHTHHDRVVIALSGATLEHILPDGRVQPSTLKTGEIVWRLGGTHVGHNMGSTDLWVIAVEPK